MSINKKVFVIAISQYFSVNSAIPQEITQTLFFVVQNSFSDQNCHVENVRVVEITPFNLLFCIFTLKFHVT